MVMGLIGFSHHYHKIHGQICGDLLATKIVELTNEDLHSEAIKYDTMYSDLFVRTGYFPMKPGKYVLLVFLGNKNIPFTTYRKIPTPYIPFFECRRQWDGHTPYSDFIGFPFSFKFKGEPIDPSVDVWKGQDWTVKIID